MLNIDMVIKGLESCWVREPGILNCKECPYKEHLGKGRGQSCTDRLHLDSLKILQMKEKRWIPVSEKLPKSMANKVIVYLQHEDLVPYIGYGHYEKFKGEEMWYDLENDEQFSKRGYTVTHWMPMPTSPDGEILALC